MYDEIVRSILQDRGIAYAVTDRNLTVVEMHDPAGILSNGLCSGAGCNLLELAPELIGSEAALAALLAGQELHHRLEWVNRHSGSGATRYLHLVSLPYKDDTGEIAGLLHLVEDVTQAGEMHQRLMQSRNELRLLQDELARNNLELVAANAELRQLDELKSNFISMAGHELRTPLASIMGYVEVLLDGGFGALSEVQRRNLDIVQQSAARLLKTINDMLDITRIEAGKVELHLQPTDIREIVNRLMGELQLSVQEKRHALTVMAPNALPLALADELRASQVIGNLLSNAIKYTPPGGKIEVSLRHTADGFLEAAVADNGIGIALEDQARLYGRFFRARPAQHLGTSGSGLGLYIARSLVELHGGRIELTSQLGQGSTFRVTFPLADLTETGNDEC